MDPPTLRFRAGEGRETKEDGRKDSSVRWQKIQSIYSGEMGGVGCQSGTFLETQMPAISVAGILIFLPFLSRKDSMLAETSDALKSKGSTTN